MNEVTIQEMLTAREERVKIQQNLLLEYKATLICFTMNIPGPIKISPSVIRAFEEGCTKLEKRIPEEQILYRSHRKEKTGCEAYYVVNADALRVKRICTEIEDESRLGRLFDMDVLNGNGEKLDRESVNGKSRDCIVCGAKGRGCASRRIHSVEELQAAIDEIIWSYFREKDAGVVADNVVRSLIEEVMTTPKPGLVDHENNGSHKDMDLTTFLASARALKPYFMRCVELGNLTRALKPSSAFLFLQQEGIDAEQLMFQTTGGVNTHKGAIYIMGTLCGAIGRCWTVECPIASIAEILETSAELVKDSNQTFFDKLEESGEGKTAGERLYLQYGMKGVRGELENGLPSVAKIAFPVFQKALEDGFDRNYAGCVTLLHLISRVTDTTLYHRGGKEGADYAAVQAAKLLENSEYPTCEAIREMDRLFVQRNLSPGGCADLLAVTYFFDLLENGIQSVDL